MADAPGEPGQPPRWPPVGKSGVGRSLRDDARVWFTIGNGILNEIAYPRIEQTTVRDFGLIVTDGETLFAEERRDCVSTIAPIRPGIPAYHLTSTHKGGRFRLHKRIIADPMRPTLLQQVRVEDLQPDGPRLRVHALLAPHLVNVSGTGTAWTGDYKGEDMMFAEAQGVAVALAVSSGWVARSAGYAGISDGWQDLSRHRRMTWQYERAINGNVALTGEIADAVDGTPFVLCLGFGRIWTEAAMRARSGLFDSFDRLETCVAVGWSGWLDGMQALGAPALKEAGPGSGGSDFSRTSLMVIHTHGCPSVPGARIASVGVPWAALQNNDYPAACHLVRARDVVAGAVGLFAAGNTEPVLEALSYLQTVQEADGHWPQNFWLDGMPAWQGLQLDETAQPVMLADFAWREGLLTEGHTRGLWPMVRAAALALARHDPLAGQDRWGRSGGVKLHTLGAEIVGLLIGADWAERAGEPALQRFLLDTADSVRELLFALLDEPGSAASPIDIEADPDIVSLVRFGLLPADDPRLSRALAAIDGALKVELPGGPGWYRQDDGAGAPRPILAIERANLAIAAGRHDEALALLAAIEACAGEGDMLPERVDHASGRGGMVMPHLWTHAEHVRLLRSIQDRRLFGQPTQALERYASPAAPRIVRWRTDNELAVLPEGRVLRVEVPVAADLHWSDDGWVGIQDTPVVETGPGIFVAELPTASLDAGSSVVFTWRERGSGAWLGVDHHIAVRPTTNAS